MSDVFAPFTLPLRREGDAAIVDAAGRTVLVIDPERDIDDDRAVDAIADHVFALLAAAPAPSSLAGGEEAEFATALARVLDRHGLRDAGWADAAIDEALSVVREPSAVSRATVDAILPMISERLAALSPEAPAREGVVMAASDAPMWADGIVTDGENVAMAQKAETDHGGDYWAVDGGNGGLDWEPTHFISLDAPTPRHEAPARNPLDPDAPSEAMIDAGLKVDWSNEDERGTVINVWYAMNAARRHEAPASHAFEASHSVQREGGCKVCGHDEASHEAPAEGAGEIETWTDEETCSAAEKHGAIIERNHSPDYYHDAISFTPPELREFVLALRARSSAPEAREVKSVGEAEPFNAHMTCATFSKGEVPVGTPLYTHPAPDALRIAVEALEPFSEIAGRYLAGGMRADLEARSPSLLDLIEPRDFYRARTAFAALKAEQGAK